MKAIPGGFSFAPNFILDHEGLGKNEILTYLAIARYAKVESDTAVLYQETIAKTARLHRTSVNASIKILKELGLISVEHQVNRRGTTACRYTLHNQGPVERMVISEFVPDDSTPDDEFEEPPAQSGEYRTGTGVSTTAVHRINNNTLNNKNNKNSILSKDSIKRDADVTSPKQSTLFSLAKKKDPLLELPFMDKKVLDEYIKGIRGRERSTLKFKLAELGKCSWEELSDTDFVYYYVDRHNEVMKKPLAVTGTPGVDAGKIKSFRNTYNISKGELYSIIPKLLLLYKDTPECDGCLNFGTLANAHFISGPLVERVRYREENTFKVETNKFNFTEEQIRNAPEVF